MQLGVFTNIISGTQITNCKVLPKLSNTCEIVVYGVTLINVQNWDVYNCKYQEKNEESECESDDDGVGEELIHDV